MTKCKCNTNLESLVFHVPQFELIATVLYRPQTYQVDLFKENLLHLIAEIDTFPNIFGGTLMKIFLLIQGVRWLSGEVIRRLPD